MQYAVMVFLDEEGGGHVLVTNIMPCIRFWENAMGVEPSANDEALTAKVIEAIKFARTREKIVCPLAKSFQECCSLPEIPIEGK